MVPSKSEGSNGPGLYGTRAIYGLKCGSEREQGIAHTRSLWHKGHLWSKVWFRERAKDHTDQVFMAQGPFMVKYVVPSKSKGSHGPGLYGMRAMLGQKCGSKQEQGIARTRSIWHKGHFGQKCGSKQEQGIARTRYIWHEGHFGSKVWSRARGTKVIVVPGLYGTKAIVDQLSGS